MKLFSLVRFTLLSGAAMFVALTQAIAQQPADSIAAHKKAVRAQSDFELYRRRSLPVRAVDAALHNCDARIGRFCQWNSVDDTVPPGEPRGIGKGRDVLLKSLENLATRAPRDGWITGQRVRYLLESGDDSAAVAVARSCSATEWWCAALLGLALHESRQGLAADSAFGHALATMPADERCRWTDMTPVLNAAQRKRFGPVGCGNNEQLASRLWWLTRWIGLTHISLLDGGIPKWIAEARTLSREVPLPIRKPVALHGYADPSMVVSADEVKSRLGDAASMLLIDARAAERYRGEVEPIDLVAGHIPGAYNRFYKENLNSDLTMRGVDDLRGAFGKTLGTTPSVQVVHQCGSGVTACANIFAMEFRHDSWAEAHELLLSQGVAWCVAQTDDKDPKPEDLSWEPAGYLRLRKTEYTDEELRSWADKIKPALENGSSIFCYFKHEDEGASPQMAKRLEAMLS